MGLLECADALLAGKLDPVVYETAFIHLVEVIFEGYGILHGLNLVLEDGFYVLQNLCPFPSVCLPKSLNRLIKFLFLI